MPYVDFLTKVHTATKRDYRQRVLEADKARCAEAACKFGKEYWDGDRQTGYGGYRYDGRWRPVAQAMVDHYKLKPGQRILDIGCGKGFLLYEFTQIVPGIQVTGIDISRYALDNAKEEVKPFLQEATAAKLPFEDRSFDFVVSITTLHNLYNFDLWPALREMERDGQEVQVPCRRGVPQRTGKSESNVLAADLPGIPHSGRMGVALRPNRLFGRLLIHLFRMTFVFAG